MARFYKTSTPTFIDDKMFQLPYQMMGQVMQAKDKAVDSEITAAVDLFGKLKANVYESDLPRAKQIIQEKEAKVNEIVEGIRKNPMEYNKYSSAIRKLSRDINSTWNTGGEVALMEQNNTSILSKIKEIQDLHKDDAEYANAAIKRLKDSYNKGLEFDAVTATGKGKPDLRQTYSLDFEIDDFIKNKLAPSLDWEFEEDRQQGNGYILRDKKTRETLSPEKVATAMQTYLAAHPEIQNAVQDRSNLGLTDFKDANLNTAVKFGEKGDIEAISEDWYGKNIRAAISNMAYSKTKDSKTLHTDQPWLTKEGWAREDEKENVEIVGSTYEHVFQVDANSAQSFDTALSTTNMALLGTYGKILSASGIDPNSTIGQRILKGNSHDIETALSKAEPGTAQSLKNQYTALRTQKNFLKAQGNGFEEYYKKKTGKTINTRAKDWLNKETQKAYNDYLTANNSLGKNNVVTTTVTLDKVGVNPKTIKDAQEKIVQNFDDLVFNVDQTQKGSFLTFEKNNGDKVIYVPQGHKVGGKTATPSGLVQTVTKNGKSHKVYYKTAPGGMLSVQSLMQEELIKPIIVSENGEEKTKYTTRYNGKEVGVVPDEKTFGLAQALDNSGRSNYGMNMQIGDYRLPVLIPTDKIKIPSVDNYVQNNYEDLQFRNFINRTNLKTLGKTVSKGPQGSTLVTEGDRAFVIEANGTKHEILAPEQKLEIFKINFAER